MIPGTAKVAALATSPEERALNLARQLANCCEGHSPVEVVTAITGVLSAAVANVAEHSVEVSRVLGAVQHRAYDGAMTLIAARQPRH